MAQALLMPALSPTMEEGILARWLVKEGDAVQSGDIIAEIETDKATMEVEAVDEGTIAKILVHDGAEAVKVNSIIAVIAEDGDGEDEVNAVISAHGTAAAAPEPIQNSASMQKEDTGSDPQKKPEAAQTDNIKEKANTGKKEGRIFASPLAKRIALNEGLDLQSVTGSGPRGRIIKKDIEAALKQPKSLQTPALASEPAKPQPSVAGLPDDLPYEDIPNSGMRKTIAARLTEAKNEIPHYYVSIDCKLDALLDLRKTLNAQSPEGEGSFKISVNDMIIKASALALKEVPEMNVAWGGSFVRRFGQADIAVAVATDNGLITPIVRNAGEKGLSTIANGMVDLAGRARKGKLSPREYQGGTFTISNLGMFGTKQFQAIVNPPAAGILAIGAGEKRPVVENNALAIATVMTVTLSADHRSTDGVVGALFIKAFKKYIENPLSMML